MCLYLYAMCMSINIMCIYIILAIMLSPLVWLSGQINSKHLPYYCDSILPNYMSCSLPGVL